MFDLQLVSGNCTLHSVCFGVLPFGIFFVCCFESELNIYAILDGGSRQQETGNEIVPDIRIYIHEQVSFAKQLDEPTKTLLWKIIFFWSGAKNKRGFLTPSSISLVLNVIKFYCWKNKRK